MLIYFSSYPRSGNTWLRHLLRHYFDQRATSIYPEAGGSPNLVQNEDGSFGPYFSEYKSQYFPSITRRRLINGCIPLLNEEFRSLMGASDEYFFLKTHELPYDRYFEGEYVLHLVRHPAAVFWSYYNFLQDFESDIAPKVTIEDVIKGETPFGSWSAYNEQWLECGRLLGDRFWLYSYEQLVSGEGEFCENLSSLTGLPIYKDIGSFPSFEHWHRTAPKFYRSGKADAWKSHLSESQIKLINSLHGPTIEKLGYELDKHSFKSSGAERAELHRSRNIDNESSATMNNFKLERSELQRQLTNLQARFALVKAERDQATETLQVIARTRAYKLLRYLGRWQGLKIPVETDPTQAVLEPAASPESESPDKQSPSPLTAEGNHVGASPNAFLDIADVSRVSKGQANHTQSIQDNFWPPSQAFLPVSKIPQTSDGKVRCLRVAICDDHGKAKTAFSQGEQAHFFYEFEILDDIGVPSANLLLHGADGRVIHGKNSFQYSYPLLDKASKGTCLRFHQKISLELGPGVYFLTVELASVPKETYRDYRTNRIGYGKFTLTMREHSRVTNIGTIMVGRGPRGELLHQGLANLPGASHLSILPSSLSTSSSTLIATPSSDQLSLAENESPTIFHITHWKAGSQWIHKILQACVPERIVTPEAGGIQFQGRPIQAGKIYPTLYITHQQFKNVHLPQYWHRFVVIRDLRDTLISAYFSFKVSHPAVGWIPEWRDILQTLDLEAGLMWVMEKWLPRCANVQTSWMVAGEPLIHYEDLLENDLEILERVLIKKGNLAISPEKLEAVVLANRFEQSTGRQPGQEDISAHIRKGVSGDWRNYFGENIKRSFKESYGGLLVATGYEKDLNW